MAALDITVDFILQYFLIIQIVEKITSYHIFISKMYVWVREPVGVSRSFQTRIPVWTNPTVYLNNAEAIGCTWEHRRKILLHIDGLVKTWGVPGSTENKLKNTGKHWRHPWELRAELLECRRHVRECRQQVWECRQQSLEC